MPVPIESIEILEVELPLRIPYRLPYGPVTKLNSLVLYLRDSDGCEGWGESTPLPGYSATTYDQALKTHCELAARAVGQAPEDIATFFEGDGFLWTGLASALESRDDTWPGMLPEIPLIALVQESSALNIREKLHTLRQAGYRTFKMKVGILPLFTEIEILKSCELALRAGEWLRLDANQSLTPEAAHQLLEACSPDKIAFLEQPLPVEQWKETAELAKCHPIPLMLDEGITDIVSLKKAADSGVAWVKLKLMKQGSRAHLTSMVQAANAAGLRVILGNGVSGPLSNRQECLFWLNNLTAGDAAGEMCGYLKVSADTGPCGISFRNGSAVLTRTAVAPQEWFRPYVKKRHIFSRNSVSLPAEKSGGMP